MTFLCRNRSLSKRPIAERILRDWWSLQLQKKVHWEVDVVEALSIDSRFEFGGGGGKSFPSQRERGGLFHFETFLCTQASFVESFLLIVGKTIGGIKCPLLHSPIWWHQVWQCVTCNKSFVVKSNNFFPYCIVTWFQFYFHSICHD